MTRLLLRNTALAIAAALVAVASIAGAQNTASTHQCGDIFQANSSRDAIHFLSQGIEPIQSLLSGSPIYSVVHTVQPEGAVPGLYKRVPQGWQPLVRGKVMADIESGAPLVQQLNLSKVDDKGYVLAVIDNKLFLLSKQSDLNDKSSFIQLGSAESPLFEVGSKQKRYLSLIPDSSHLSLFQFVDENSDKSELVLISVRFEHPQTVGTGITFVIELQPNKDEKSIQLNGTPVVVDYDFHDSKTLSTLAHTLKTNPPHRVVYSKILMENVDNSDWSIFGGHEDTVTGHIKTWIAGLMSAEFPGTNLSHSTQKIGYNTSTHQIVKEIAFEKSQYKKQLLEVIQEYSPGESSSSTVKIKMRQNTYEFNGKIDLLKSGSPAVWDDDSRLGGALFSIDGELKGVIAQNANLSANKNAVYSTFDLGPTGEFLQMAFGQSELPVELKTQFLVSGKDAAVKRAAVLVSAKFSDGSQKTAIQMLNCFNSSLFVREFAPVPLLGFFVNESEMQNRISKDEGGEDFLFDSLTPQVPSEASYLQTYDPSKPHLNLLATESGRFVYKFKKPNHTLKIAENIALANFASLPGIEDPSGIFYNVEESKITGNEEKKIVGEVLLNPKNAALADKKDHVGKDYIFAKTTVKLSDSSSAYDDVRGEDDEEDGKNIKKLYLLAVDANRDKGENGYQFVLFFPNTKGKAPYEAHPIAIPAPFQGKIGFLQDVMFIKGRKESKSLVFLLLSFKSEINGEKTEATYFAKINLESESVKLMPLTDVALTPADLKTRVGFDDKGLPIVILTADLSHDAHGFTVMDLGNGNREFPNQPGGSSKKAYKFGEYEGSSGFDSIYLKTKDDWRAYGYEIKKKYPELGRSGELAQFDSFIELGSELDKMAISQNQAKRMILVVPPSLRDTVWDFILKRATDESSDNRSKADHAFNLIKNSDLALQVFDPEKGSQEQFFANTDFWSKQKKMKPQVRNFLLARADELLKGDGSPAAAEPQRAFQIQDVGSAGQDAGITNVASVRKSKLPNSLYLLAAERPMPLPEFRNLKESASASMLILATPEEMKSLESQASAEIENGLLEKFEIKEIKDPDQESMATSLASIFTNPDVQTLQYAFSGKEIRPKIADEAQNFSTVIDYAISRFTHLNESKKDSKFESFMRFRTAFAAAVLSDKTARKSRVIDKFFVERVLTQVFDIPMNLATLPPDDPLKIWSRPDALLLLQDAGYSGPFKLKADVRDTLLSQTRADAGKPIPSSIILFGNTGAGKTFMFKSIVKMLKLKMYDFQNANNNTDASAIIVNVGQISESTTKADGTKEAKENEMDIDRVINHLNTFLSLPNGFRGYILLDDIHAAPDAVKARLLTWLRNIFEAQDGMYSVKNSAGNIVRRPVRNLNIFTTLNPTADQEQIAKYAKDKAKPTTEEILLATLSTQNFRIEPSFLRRWGRTINLDYMPAGAKGPELIKSMARASNNLLNTHNRIALVDPRVVQSLVYNNEKVDARSFLSASTSALIEVASNDQKAGSLVFVVPSKANPVERGGAESWSQLGGDSSPTERITKWVLGNTRTLSLDSGLEGNLVFIEMIADAFRIPVFESLIMALQEDRRFAGDTSVQKTLLAPILAGILDHLQERSHVYAQDLDLKASDFGLKTQRERDYFRGLLEITHSGAHEDLFPHFFRSIDAYVSTWRDVNNDTAPEPVKTHKMVLSETIQANRRLLAKRLSQVLRVAELDALPTPESWLSTLSSEPGNGAKAIGQELAEGLWQYLPKMFDKDILDEQPEGTPSLSVYAATRLYLYTIDRSIAQMPWVKTSTFLLKALDQITQDQVVSQRSGVQNFLFNDPQRLIKPTITDFALQIIQSSQTLDDLPETTRAKLKQEFKNRYKEFWSKEIDSEVNLEK